MKDLPYIAVGNGELNDNKNLVPGEFIPCRNCGTLCEIKTHGLEKTNGSLETTTCFTCGKTYLIGIDCLYLWKTNDNEIP